MSGMKQITHKYRFAFYYFVNSLLQFALQQKYLQHNCPTLYDYLIQKLSFSATRAYYFNVTIKALKKYPSIMPFIKRGVHDEMTIACLFSQLRSNSINPVDLFKLLEVTKQRSVKEIRQITSQLNNPLCPQFHETLTLSISTPLKKKLADAKTLLSHKYSHGIKVEEIVEEALEIFLKKQNKSIRTKKEHLVTSRYIPVALKRQIWQLAQGRCQYVNSDGSRCNSTWRLEIDHIKPWALGGKTILENLRLLCHYHNQYEAQRLLGPQIRRHLIKKYLVGGAVRDLLLGKEAQDRDYVVIGSTPNEMIAAGFRPVGKHFPVFIDKKTKEEYALARKEIKNGQGHGGFDFIFTPEISLEDDLRRRDLTINAMAMDHTKKIIDPFGGQQDLQKKILRHVSPHFVEDPLRVLRVARFAAQLPTFTVAPETLTLMRQITESNELATLSGERIFLEFKKALLSPAPHVFFEILLNCHALEKIFPELNALRGISQNPKYHPEGDAYTHTMLVLQNACSLSKKLEVRFACLVHDLGKAQTPAHQLPHHKGHEQRGVDLIEQLCTRLKCTRQMQRLACHVAQYHLKAHQSLGLPTSEILYLLERSDAHHNTSHFEDFLLCCQADSLGKQQTLYPQADFLRKCQRAIKSVDGKELAQRYQGKELQDQLQKFKIEAIEQLRH